MKKMMIVSLMIFVMGMCVFSAERFMVSVVGNYFVPADGGYKDIYGSSMFDPELKAGYKIFGDVYIWAGYGFFSRTGETKELKEEAKSTQHFLSAGAGYNGTISKRMGFNVELGLFNASYKEEAMDEAVTGSAMGFGVKGEILFGFGKGLFAKITLGYTRASDTIEEEDIKLGGFNSGIGVEVRF